MDGLNNNEIDEFFFCRSIYKEGPQIAVFYCPFKELYTLSQ